MTGILISIRNPAEAKIAARYPIDLFDLKDPLDGSLGEVKPNVRQEIVSELTAQQTKSIALGELVHWSQANRATSDDLSWLNEFQYAKIGLAQTLNSSSNWQTDWLSLRQRIPVSVTLVGVAYTDWQRCNAPPPEQVFKFVASLPRNENGETNDAGPFNSQVKRTRRQTILLDTHFKTYGSTIDILRWRKIESLIELAQLNEIEIVVAGSLRFEDLARIIDLSPNFIGLRGAVCERGRSELAEHKLSELFHRWIPAG